MLLQFMARTGARRKREGQHSQPDTPGDPTGPFTRRTGLENLSAPQNGDRSQTPWKGAQPNRWSGLENPDADQNRKESNLLTLNLLKSRPSLGQSIY